MNSQWYLKAMPLNNAEINVPIAHIVENIFPICFEYAEGRNKNLIRSVDGTE